MGLDPVCAGDGKDAHLVLLNLHSMATPDFSLLQWEQH